MYLQSTEYSTGSTSYIRSSYIIDRSFSVIRNVYIICEAVGSNLLEREPPRRHAYRSWHKCTVPD